MIKTKYYKQNLLNAKIGIGAISIPTYYAIGSGILTEQSESLTNEVHRGIISDKYLINDDTVCYSFIINSNTIDTITLREVVLFDKDYKPLLLSTINPVNLNHGKSYKINVKETIV